MLNPISIRFPHSRPLVSALKTSLLVLALGLGFAGRSMASSGGVTAAASANTVPVATDSADTEQVGIPLRSNSVHLQANDNDGDPLTYRFVGGTVPSWLTLKPNGYLDGTPTGMGHYVLKFVANDGKADSNQGTFTLDVTEKPSLVVNALSDSGNHTDNKTELREAIAYAKYRYSYLNLYDPITFDPAVFAAPRKTITLNGSMLEVYFTLNIVGPPAGFTLDADHKSHHFGGIDLHLTLSNCNLINGQGEVGGSMVIGDDSSLNLTNCTLSGNNASIAGGALYFVGPISLTNCTLSNNSAPKGGALSSEISDVPASGLKLQSCTIVGNSATQSGGGIYNNEHTVTLNNSIVAGNNAPSFPDIAGPITSGDYNLVQNTAGTSLTGVHNITGVNAKLGTLADNGGSTPTVVPLAGSPAINAGSTDLTTDQRGVPRPQGSADDIGAVEVAASKLTIVETTPANNQNLVIAAFKSGSVTGSATSGVAISKVEMKLSRLRGGVVKNWNGTAWTTATARIPATLSGPATSVSWSVKNLFPPAAQLDEGQYIILMTATDAAGSIASVTTRVNLYLGDTQAPVASISTPTLNQKVLFSKFTTGAIIGLATDNLGVNTVRVKLSRKRGTKNYYWNGGNFATNAVWLNATVIPAGGSSVKWNIDSQLPPIAALDAGLYQIDAYALDATGNKSATVTRPFTLVNDIPPSVVTIKSPTYNQSLNLNAFGAGTINGTASDSVGITRVTLQLTRDRGDVATAWNGTAFTTTFTNVDATLSSVGGTNVTWSMSTNFPTPATGLDAGDYLLSVVAYDGLGNIRSYADSYFTLTSTSTIAPAPVATSKSAGSS